MPRTLDHLQPGNLRHSVMVKIAQTLVSLRALDSLRGKDESAHGAHRNHGARRNLEIAYNPIFARQH
jgi:hypothetical protein